MATMDGLLTQVSDMHAKTEGDLTLERGRVASLIDQLAAAQAAHDAMAGQLQAAKDAKAAADAARDNVLAQLATSKGDADTLRARVADLESQLNKPTNPDLIDVDVFRERLAPAFFAYASLADGDPLKSKWGVLLGNYLPTNRLTPVNVGSAATKGLIQQAVADGLLTPAQAAVVLATNP